MDEPQVAPVVAHALHDVDDAVRVLARTAQVDWSSDAADRYRAALAEAAQRARAVRGVVAEAEERARALDAALADRPLGGGS